MLLQNTFLSNAFLNSLVKVFSQIIQFSLKFSDKIMDTGGLEVSEDGEENWFSTQIMRHVHGVLQELRAVTVALGQEQGGRNGGTWGQMGRVEQVDTLRTYTHSGESTRWRITQTHTHDQSTEHKQETHVVL